MGQKKEIEDTAEFKRLLRIRDYIGRNRKKFIVEAVFSATKTLEDFEIELPPLKGTKNQIMKQANKYSRQRSAWQNRTNRILAQRGLYLSQHNQYFLIKSKKQTVKKLNLFKIDAERKMARRAELAIGIKTYGSVYSKVKKSELVEIVIKMQGSNSKGISAR